MLQFLLVANPLCGNPLCAGLHRASTMQAALVKLAIGCDTPKQDRIALAGFVQVATIARFHRVPGQLTEAMPTFCWKDGLTAILRGLKVNQHRRDSIACLLSILVRPEDIVMGVVVLADPVSQHVKCLHRRSVEMMAFAANWSFTGTGSLSGTRYMLTILFYSQKRYARQSFEATKESQTLTTHNRRIRYCASAQLA
jgi:hypothetical protein